MSNRLYLGIEMVTVALIGILAVSSSKLERAETSNRKAVKMAYSAPEESTNLLQKAIRLDGTNPVYRFNLGLHLTEKQGALPASELLGKCDNVILDSASVLIEDAVTMSSEEPVFLLNQALIEEFSGNRNAAIALLEPMTRYTHCWVPIRLVYGLWQEAAGNREQARSVYSRAIIQSPVVIESPFFKELSERDYGLANEARLAALEETRGLMLEKPSPLLKASLGEQEYYTGNKEVAISLLTEALAEQPSMNRPWLFLGRMAEEDRNIKKAAECYEKAALLDNEDALAAYFKALIKGGASVRAEQMQDMIAIPQRIGLFARYGSRVLTPYLIIPDLEVYCTYDYVGEIQSNQYKTNLCIQENLRAALQGKEMLSLAELTLEVAAFFVGTPCEAGLLDIWPEMLRIRLDRTDPLHFVEMSIALAETLKSETEAPPESFYESLCKRVKQLRYRNGIVDKFSDRIYYFSEWAAQAQALGLLDELSGMYGKEYQQRFSYLSDHLFYLPQIGKEPQARDEVLVIERTLNASGPYYRIESGDLDSRLITDIQEGDIIAFVSDRKGEDVSKLAIIHKEGNGIKLIQASLRDKKIMKVDFPSSEEMKEGIRLFRIL